MGSLGIAGGLHLSSVAFGERNGENTYKVTILGLGLNESLDEGVPFLDKLAELITSDVHTVEVGVAVETFDFLALESYLSPCLLVSIVVEFTK